MPDIAEAKLRLPLPDLMVKLGLAEHAKKSACCPFHEDSHESFSVVKFGNSWIWKCFAGCGKGDEIAFLEKRDGLSNAEAIRRYCDLAEVNGGKGAAIRKPTVTPLPMPQPKPTPEPDFSAEWPACVSALTNEWAETLAARRGYSVELVRWLREQKFIGLHEGKVALPVHDETGRVVACHYRKEDGSWRYCPGGCKVRPLVIGEPKTADLVFAFESQWDAFAVLDKLDWHKQALPGVAVIVTRGASNGGKLRGLVSRGATVYAFRQNDAVADKWLQDVTTAATADGGRVKLVGTPVPHKDCNEWTQAGATAIDLNAAMEASSDVGPSNIVLPVLEFLRPSQLRDYRPPEGIVLVGDCHIVRGSVFVIGGAPGVGKSRAAVALSVAGATGADWFDLKVHTRFRTMIVQNENGRFRLSREFADLDCPVLDDFVRVCPPPPLGLAFERVEFQAALTAAIENFHPDVIVVDPWNAVARDEKAKDYLETFNAIRAVIPTGDNAPALGIVAHTRKPKGDERTTGRGLLNLLAGSYVLGSVPRTVFILQSASDDPEDDRVVWTCCKNNDGELGARSAWQRRNGLFAEVTNFDWTALDGAQDDAKRKVSVQDVAETIGVGNRTAYSRLAESVAERCGVSERTAKDAIKRAADAGVIRKDEDRLYEVN